MTMTTNSHKAWTDKGGHVRSTHRNPRLLFPKSLRKNRLRSSVFPS
jgi:hypothetical protein